MVECPILKEAGVSYTNAGYGQWRDPEEAQRVKDLCLNCPYTRCVFDKQGEKKKRLENTLLDLMGRAYLTSRQVKRLQRVQQQLEEINGNDIE